MNKLLHAAWTSDKLVFPSNPAEVKQRWFLRTPINPAQDRDLVFIGINPSTATRFANQSSGGDKTTEMILNSSFFNEDDSPLKRDGSPRKWRSLTIVNLIPLIGQSHDLLDRDDEIDLTIPTTVEVLETVLASAQFIHLMWGNKKDPKFPWKTRVMKKLAPTILSLTVDKQVQAYLSQSGDPLHPGFGGLDYWHGKNLCKDARGALA